MIESSIADPLLEEQAEKEQDLLKPSLYQVIILNDDYTPINFVISLIKSLFFKTEEVAEILALQIHNEGESIIAKYPLEVALMKVKQIHQMAKAEGYPLKAITRKE